MSRCVDASVLPVAIDRITGYQEFVSMAGEFGIELGGLQNVECVGEDLNPDVEGVEMVRFADLEDAGPDETVIIGFVGSESHAHRAPFTASRPPSLARLRMRPSWKLNRGS